MPSLFESEISQQPAELQRLVDQKFASVAEIAARLQTEALRFVVIAARGTSDNAARYAKYMISAFKRLPVGLAMPSLYTLYDQPPDMRDCLVIGISQSGQGTDVVAVLEEARRQGAITLAITNDAASPMAQMSNHAILLDVGVERSVAASKTYTAQLTAVAMLVASWSGRDDLKQDLHRLPGLAQFALDQAPAVQQAAQRIGDSDRLVLIGRGYNYCTALEIGLKIKELSYINSQSYSSADFRHGPIAVLEPGFPLLAVAPLGKTTPDMRSLAADVSQLQVDLTALTNDPELLQGVPSTIRLPDDLPEWLSPIVGAIPGQLMALHLAQARGLDVDHPRLLRKVTLTF